MDNLGWWDQFVILLAQILTIFDLLNPNFDKNLGNVWFLGLKGQKLSNFLPIRWQIDPFIPIYQLYWNLDLKNAQFWQKIGLFVKIRSKKKLP